MRQQNYNSLLASGNIDPDHWAELTLQLVDEQSGKDAWRRACRLIDTALHLPAAVAFLPDIAEFCVNQGDEAVAVEPVVMTALPERLARRWEPLIAALEEIVPFARAAGGGKAAEKPKGQSSAGAASSEGYWRRGSTGQWYFVKMDMKGEQAAPVGDKQKAAPAEGEAKPPKGEQAGGAPGKGGEQGGKSMSKEQAAQQQAMQQQTMMQKVIEAAKEMIKKVRTMGSAAWDKVKGMAKSEEIKVLSKQVGVGPKRLRNLDGKDLKALANPARTPASPHVPLKKRGEVPDLTKEHKKMDPVPAKRTPPPPIPERPGKHKVPDGGLPSKGSPYDRQQKQQESLPASASARAVSIVNKISQAKDFGEKNRHAIAKAVGSLSFPEALHVYRQLVPPHHQGKLPVPRTSAEAAAGLDHSLKATQKTRNDIGSVIAANRGGADVVKALTTSSAGKRHAQLTREGKAIEKQAGEAKKNMEKGFFAKMGFGGLGDQVESLMEQKTANDKERNKISESGREVIAKSLESVGHESRITDHSRKGVLSSEQSKAVDDVKNWLGRTLRGGVNLRLDFKQAEGNRAYAIPGEHPHSTTEVFLAKGTRHKTVIHEIGHAIENQVPGAREAVANFIKHRCGNEKMRDMGEIGGHVGEMGRKDAFDKHFSERSAHYVGKSYKPDSDDTEILSMGLQEMYTDPVGFARNDPEYFSLIHGILSGKTRM